MSNLSDEAFSKAKAAIALAKAQNHKDLSLTGLGFPLSRIPDEIAELGSLKRLYLWHSFVEDLTPISNMKSLTTLNLSRSSVRSLAPIAGLTEITALDVSDTTIRSLKEIAGLTKLRALEASRSLVDDLGPLAELRELRWLLLLDTRVRDLSVLSECTKISRLAISGSRVEDLSPILKMPNLRDRPDFHGLVFRNIPATRLDDGLHSISRIGPAKERAAALFDYLEPSQPPVDPPAPQIDPLLETILINGRLELAPDAPTEEERKDRVRRLLHDQMRDPANDLMRVANRHPKLGRLSGEVAALIDRPFDELDLLMIHVKVEDLEARRRLGREDGEAFDEEVMAALGDLTRRGPGVTVGHPDVDALIERVRLAREEPMSTAQADVHHAVAMSVIGDPEAHGPRSIAMEVEAENNAEPAAREAIQKDKHQGLIYYLAAGGSLVTVAAAKGVVSTVSGDLLGPAVEHWLVTNWPILLDLSQTYGGFFLGWFASAMEPVMLRLGVEEFKVRAAQLAQKDKGTSHPNP
jgi:hypothetical protein